MLPIQLILMKGLLKATNVAHFALVIAARSNLKINFFVFLFLFFCLADAVWNVGVLHQTRCPFLLLTRLDDVQHSGFQAREARGQKSVNGDTAAESKVVHELVEKELVFFTAVKYYLHELLIQFNFFLVINIGLWLLFHRSIVV